MNPTKTASRVNKPSPFTVINKVRDTCNQSDINKRYLLLVLATYCDRDGICYPGNRALVASTSISKRAIQRMLRVLVSEGEIQILASGRGRGQKRIIRLTRYAVVGLKHDGAMARLNAPASPMESVPELPKGTTSQDTGKEGVVLAGSAPPSVYFSEPKISYPESEDEMAEMLDRCGVEYDPTYDGNFFDTMSRCGWTIKGERIWDWPATYKARLEKTRPRDFVSP